MTKQSVYGEQTGTILQLAEQVRAKALRNLERDGRPAHEEPAPEEPAPERGPIEVVVDGRGGERWVVRGTVVNVSRPETTGRRGASGRPHAAGG